MNRLFIITSITGLMSFFLSSSVSAQIPDAGFGENGSTYTGFGNFHSYCMASALHTNGKIVAAGYNGNSTNAVLVSQYNNDGSPDLEFNGTGKLQFSFGSVYEEGLAVAVLPDGGIIVGGLSFGDAALAYINHDGSFNTSFNGTGFLRVSFGPGNGSRIEKLLIMPDLKILAVGRAYNGSNFDFMAMKLDLSGQLDEGFGTGGKVLVDVAGYADYGFDAGLQSDGSIVIGGYSLDAQSSSSFSAIRLTPEGSRDLSFGDNGRFLFSPGSLHNEIDALDIQEDDRIVLAGRTDFNSILIRLMENGAPDLSFGTNGYNINDIDGLDDRFYDVVVQPDGRILAGGWAFTETGLTEHVVARYLSGGSLDNSFNENGIYQLSLGEGGSWANQLMIQPDGMLLIGGQASLVLMGYAHFALHRLSGVTTGFVAGNHPSLKAYPNPATSRVFIDLPLSLMNGEVRIFDMAGRICSERLLNLQHGILDVSGLNPGIYFVSITQGNQSGKFRLVRH